VGWVHVEPFQFQTAFFLSMTHVSSSLDPDATDVGQGPSPLQVALPPPKNSQLETPSHLYIS
jgi:hypothetical protein